MLLKLKKGRSELIKSDLQTETSSFVDKYPQFVDAIKKQKEDLFWTSDEIDLNKDKHDLRKKLSHQQRHALSFNQKLFTKYESVIGVDYWANIVLKRYKRHEIQRMAACFADVEMNIHFPFYRKVNEVLGVHNDEFYSQFETDPMLIERVKFMQDLVVDKDSLASMGGFAFMEGAVLFTAFAMIKSLGVKGQNFMPNLISGIDMSCLDESHHMELAAEIFKLQKKQEKRTKEELKELEEKIYNQANYVLEHEKLIIKAMLSEGDIPFAGVKDLESFAAHRCNLVLNALGYTSIFDESEDTVSEWFYPSMNSFKFNDNFYSRGRNYKKEFTEKDFDIFSDDSHLEVLEKAGVI